MLLLKMTFEESQMCQGHCNIIAYSQKNEGEMKEKNAEEEKIKVKQCLSLKAKHNKLETKCSNVKH